MATTPQRRGRRIVALGAVLCCGVLASTTPGQAVVAANSTTIVWVTSSSNAIPRGDAIAINHLRDRGHTVSVVDDDAASASDANAAALIVITSNAAPAKVGGTFRDVAVPVIVSEPYLFDDMGMTGTGSGDRGQVGNQSRLDVVAPGHPLAAGLPDGTHDVATSNSTFSWAAPAPAAVIVATVADDPSRAAIFEYGTGAVMVDGTAPANRIGFYLGPVSTKYWSPAAVALFDAAIARTVQPPANQAPTIQVDQPIAVIVDQPVVIDATIADDGLVAPLSVEWTVPAGIAIDDPHAHDPTVTASAAGTHTLGVAASDGEHVTTRSVDVVATAAGGGDGDGDGDGGDGNSTIGFVTSSSNNVPAADAAMIDHLTATGVAVEVIDDHDADAIDADGVDAIFISSTVAAFRISDTYNGVTIPVIVAEPFLFDDMGLTGAAGKDRGQTGNQRDVDVAEPLHQLAGGLTGRARVTSGGTSFSWGVPGDGATVVATIKGRTDRAAVFHYDTAAPMVDGTAAGPRVGFFTGAAAARVWTDAGISLFDAAIDLAVNGYQPPTNTPPTVDAGPDVVVGATVAFDLVGDVSDDGWPGPLTTTWSAPTGITVTDPSAATTTAVAQTPGSYVVTLEATDGEFTVSDSMTVEVGDAPITRPAIFIAGSANPPASERPAIDRLVTLGFDVTVIDDDVATASDADSAELVVITSTIAPWKLDPAFADLAVPVVVWEPKTFDEFGFVPTSGAQGEVTQSHLYIDATAHQITAGFPADKTTVYTAAHKQSWGRPEGDVSILARTGPSSNRAVMFTYERGAPMANGTAPARRVGLFMGPAGPSLLSDDGWELFDRSIVWAAQSPYTTPAGERVTDGLLALYEFVDGAGAIVGDSAATSDPLDLHIEDPAAVTWLTDGGLRLDTPSTISSIVPAAALNDAIVDGDEVTIELWFRPTSVSNDEPGRLISIAPDDSDRNLLLNQGMTWSTNDRIDAMIRTTRAGAGALPSVESPIGSLTTNLHHVALVRSADQMQRLYLDGQLADEAAVEGTFDNWDTSWPLSLGSDVNGARPWLGEFHLAAVYGRALSSGEVCHNRSLGPGHYAYGAPVGPTACIETTTVRGELPYDFVADASASSAADGGEVTYAWDFGDGNTASSAAVSHRFDSAGDWPVALTVTDELGRSASSGVTVVVQADPALPTRPPDFDDALGYRAGGGYFDLVEWNWIEQWLGTDIALTTQFVERQSPSAMVTTSNQLFTAPDAALAGQSDEVQVVLGVPLGFGNASAQSAAGRLEVGSNLASVANGDHDDAYLVVAQRLVDAGFGDAILRLGYEGTARWSSWSAFQNEDAYIAAWRHVQSLFRSVSTDFTFDWTVTRGDFVEQGPTSYPGDDVVDIIGVDVYWRPDTNEAPWDVTKWNNQYAANMDAVLQFAITHDKPVSVPEWGLQNVDEPRFIEEMYRFLASLPASGPGQLAYHAYFDAGNTRERLNDFPAARERFHELFGAV